MPTPHLTALLVELNGLTHHHRVRRLALLGRDEAGTPGLSALLDGLEAEGPVFHRLALEAARADNGERVILYRRRSAAAGPTAPLRDNRRTIFLEKDFLSAG